MEHELHPYQSLEADSVLLLKYKTDQDLEVLGVLYERYMHLVYGVCLKYLKNREQSQDETMNIFEKLIVEIPKRDINEFKPWLFVLTKNHCLMILRAKANQNKYLMNIESEIMELNGNEHPSVEDHIKLRITELHRCLEEIKKEQKDCILSFYLEHKCYAEIAIELNYDLKKVKSYIQNGKRKLKICIENG